MTPGIHSLPFEDYLRSAAISRSDLDVIHHFTPAHYRAHKDGLRERNETEALRFGTLLHRALLEPDTMDSVVAKPEGMNFATRAGKDWRAEQDGKCIISFEEHVTMREMVKSLWSHPIAKRILSNADTERSLFVEDNGLMLKSRVDILPKAGNALYDVKTILDASEREFSKAIADHDWHRQGAFYLRVAEKLGLKFDAFVFIAVEKSPPYAVAIWQLDDFALDYGRKTIARDLQLVRNCEDSGEWPAYPAKIQAIMLPPWMQREAEAA